MRVWTMVASVLAVVPRFAADAQVISIETVTVGDAGNVADSTGYGAVNYQYQIARYEVTNAQYAAFLNAKASTDAYGLYNTSMAGSYGGIVRAGSSGSYSYLTVSGRENWAVNYVSFWDAARFSNWLQNGQGNGDTETGTYSLAGEPIPINSTVTRSSTATWAIASEDEWYKAAYYKGGGSDAGYWLYGTASDSITTQMANYYFSVGTPTAVGSYTYASAYGAFDMAGNVFEWTEAIGDPTNSSHIWQPSRIIRGGSIYYQEDSLVSSTRWRATTWDEGSVAGFRVALIPSAPSIGLLALTQCGLHSRRRG